MQTDTNTLTLLDLEACTAEGKVKLTEIKISKVTGDRVSYQMFDDTLIVHSEENIGVWKATLKGGQYEFDGSKPTIMPTKSFENPNDGNNNFKIKGVRISRKQDGTP